MAATTTTTMTTTTMTMTNLTMILIVDQTAAMHPMARFRKTLTSLLSYQQDDVPESLEEDDGFTESPENPERPKQ